MKGEPRVRVRVRVWVRVRVKGVGVSPVYLNYIHVSVDTGVDMDSVHRLK